VGGKPSPGRTDLSNVYSYTRSSQLDSE
jgi:hypothetical protein